MNNSEKPSRNNASPQQSRSHAPRSNASKPHTTKHHRSAEKSHSSRPSRKRQGGGGGGGSMRNNSRPTPRGGHSEVRSRPGSKIPPVAKGDIRIIPLGGVEEVGQNMTAIEIGDDIIVLDCGFQFKDELTPGIDFILPNTKYLEERKDKIRGLLITHGHLDHIGGIPFLIEKLGNPKIYSREFGAIMIRKRHEEFPHLPKLNLEVLDGDETIVCGDIRIKTFPISHTIPDAMGMIIHTDYGEIVFIEDVRVDNVKGIPTDEEVEQYKRFKDMNVLMLTMDSTSVEKPGFSISENVVVENLDKIIKETPGRLFIGTFASQVERIMAIIEAADKYGKKVAVEGRSMKSNLEIVKLLKMLKADNIIPISDVDNYPPDKVVMLVTGAQGEEFAALMRISNKSHKNLRFRPTDTILLSSSIIPGNHNAVVRLKDNLYRSEANVITYLDSDVHASGHGNREELTWIHKQIPYKFFMPLHGNHYMLRIHAELAETLGAPPENIVVPDDGSIIEIKDRGTRIEKLAIKAPNERITVDGFAVGDMQEVVLNDRQLLSESGIFVIIANVNTKTKKLKKSPDIISRGFVYLRESQELLKDARNRVKNTIEKHLEKEQNIDFDDLKNVVSNDIGKFLFQKTNKKPLVIAVVLGV